uniref:hypothetical protein n=1 Tax=Pseudomonas viridiflava TaxID=33069 RepID=UPI00198030DE
LEITLIVPTLQRGNASQDASRPLLNVTQMRAKHQRYPRHALGSLNPQSVPFVTRSVTGGMPTQSDGHDQC